jgi:hypothetical protein
MEKLIAVFYEVFLNKDIIDIRFVELQRSEKTKRLKAEIYPAKTTSFHKPQGGEDL